MADDKNPAWGGARSGAGRPKVKYTLELTAAQVVMLSEAMEAYSNDNYSTANDYNPEPLETLRALVDGVLGKD